MVQRPSPLALAVSFAAATSSVALAQEQLFKLLPPSLEPIAHFAGALAVSQGQVLASDHTDGPLKSGRVHVFDLYTGERTHVLKAWEDSLLFGGSMAMNERWTLVSSRDSPNGSDDGAVYVFESVTWKRLGVITAPDGFNTQNFGSRIAVNGDLALIGATSDNTAGTHAGAAYLMQLPTGALLHKWIGSDTVAGDLLHFVALGDERAVVSSVLHQSHTGAAYVFDVVSGQQLFKLQGSQIHPGAVFGAPVSIADGKVLIGANGEDDQGVDRSGAAYVFDLQTGVELYRLSSATSTERAQFGAHGTLTAERAFVGVPGDGNSFTDLGRVQVYDLADGALLKTIEPIDNGVGDLFGVPIAVDDCRLVVGSPWHDALGPETGAAYVSRLVELPVGQAFCGPANLNSTGASATLSAEGSRCSTDDRLTLFARQLPPLQPGYFLASDTQGFTPFVGGSQGDLCLGGTIARFVDQAATSNGLGELFVDVDPTNIPTSPPRAVQPGETWSFQCWFRDQNLAPTSNMTEGLAITYE